MDMAGKFSMMRNIKKSGIITRIVAMNMTTKDFPVTFIFID